jgi:hypothetical protein
MKKEIVVAAYDKNLDWLDFINSDIKKTVYRKGNILPLSENEILIESNAGRCVHTFFNHILKNYDNLSDYTYFVQDYPFDHWGNLIEVINNQTDELLINMCSVNIENGYYGFHNNTLGTAWQMYESIHHNGLIISCNNEGRPQDHAPYINVKLYWDILFQDINPEFYEFMPGGHFILTKEHAHKRSKDFYKIIVNTLENDIYAPWNYERLECYIFNPNYISKI